MTSEAWTRPPVLSTALVAMTLLAACGGSPSAAPTGRTNTPASAASSSSVGAPAAGQPTGPAIAGQPTSPGIAGQPTGPAVGGKQSPVPVESNPPGDIPDNLAFVAYRNTTGMYAVTYPEGWARTENGPQVSFTDKLNGLVLDNAGIPATLTVEAVRQQELPRLQQSQPAFELRTVEAISLPAGNGVRVVYRRNSAPDPVTNRQVRDEVQSFLIGVGAKQVRLDLFGPVGADNVDAYRTISRSLALG